MPGEHELDNLGSRFIEIILLLLKELTVGLGCWGVEVHLSYCGPGSMTALDIRSLGQLAAMISGSQVSNMIDRKK